MVSNSWLLARAVAARTYLNANHALGLFRNVIVPSPATVLADLVQSVFDTYVLQDITGFVGAPSFVANGRYGMIIGPVSWPTPVAVGDLVRGWFIINSGTGALELWNNFAVPRMFNVGDPPFVLRVRTDDISP
jgi:hypothetical protein